jgi:hypothetical protein
MRSNRPHRFVIPARRKHPGMLAPVIVLLLCAVPLVALFGVFGFGRPSLFILGFLLGSGVLILIARFESSTSRPTKDQGVATSPRRAVSEDVRSVHPSPVVQDTVFSTPRMTYPGVSFRGCPREDYSQFLLDEVLRSNGRGQLFCHYGQ